MAGRGWRVLSAQSIANGDTQPLGEALDLIDCSKLAIVVNVTQAATGDAPKLLIQHAAVNAEDEYMDFPTPIEVDLTVTGRTVFYADSFTRWVAWLTTGTLDTNAVVTMDIIARD